VTVLRAFTYPALHKSFFHRVVSFLSFMVASFQIGLNVRKVDLVWALPANIPGFDGLEPGTSEAGSFLFEVRDLWPAFAIAVGVLHHPLLISASEWLERFLYKHADQVVVNSPGFIDHVWERGARQIELVPNGLRLPCSIPPQQGTIPGETRSSSQVHCSLCRRAWHLERPGHPARSSRPITPFARPGDCLARRWKRKTALLAQAVQLGLSNVCFVSPVPKNEMPDVLAAANACIAILKPISMYATVYPNKVFDYMAAGRPIVLAMQGVIRKVVEEGQAGIFVLPGDARH